jgi:glycosyltransferase involved in cell wall biosynthesis
MRVVIVHNRYRSENPSGENRVVESDIEQLRADGVEVYPYIRDSDEIDNWTAVGKAGLAVRPIVSPVDAIAFRQMLRRIRPDIVHLHNPLPIISPWIVRTAKAERIPVVQTVHNYRHVCVNGIHFREGQLCTECVGKTFPWPAVQHGCYQGSRARSLPMAAAVVAHRGTWDLVDRFLPVGTAVADHLRALGIPDNRIEVRPNPVDDPGEPAPLGEGVLFVGRLSEEKGVRLLLEAWDRSGLSNTTSLTLAGDGEIRHLVEDAARRNPSVRYSGLLNQRELAEAYRASALVVVPSIWNETDGIAAVSGWAHGRPVLATKLVGAAASASADAVWLVDGTVDALADGLECALGSRSELERRGRAARAHYQLERDPSLVAPLADCYRMLAAVPRGSLALIGPDGAGKSAVADRIEAIGVASGVRVSRQHFRPGCVLPASAGDGLAVTDPHNQTVRSLPSALVRTILVWADFLAGWLGPWRRAGRRGLLVLERPWHDQVADPVRYRLPGTLVPVVEMLGRLVPRADMAVLLVGDPAEMHRRKPEIGVAEVQRQQTRWRQLLPNVALRTGEADSVGVPLAETVGALVEKASSHAHGLPTRRWVRPFGFPSRIDMHMTSAQSVASSALSIYPPQRRRAGVLARLGTVLARIGIARRGFSPPVPFDLLMAKMGVQAEGFAAMRSSAPDRWVVGVEVAGQLGYVIKAGPESDSGLQNEARLLEHLRRLPNATDLAWTVPELAFSDVVDGWRVVVTKAIPNGNPGAGPLLDEIAVIVDDLVLGRAGGLPIVHGDLAPWNLRRGRDGRLVVLDWESAEFDPRPLWDLTHFVVQQGVLLGAFSPPTAATILTGPGSVGARHAAACGIVGGETEAVRDYLERSELPNHRLAAGYRAELGALVS